jgi:hypothetical protein
MMSEQSNLNKLIDGAVSDEFSVAQKPASSLLPEGSVFVNNEAEKPKVDLSNPN